MAILRKGVTEYKRFSELFVGEEFSLGQQQPGPYVKVSPTQYAFETGPQQDASLQVNAPTLTGRYRFGFSPPSTIPANQIVYSARSPAPIRYFSYAVPTGPSGFQGNDPILGPPFAPSHYQLNVVPISGTDFPYDGGSNGVPATLYWNIPSFTNFLAITEQFNNPFKWRIWFGTVNDITQASHTDMFHDGGVGGGRLIYPANYLWAAEWTNSNTTPPSGPISNTGQAIPTGTAFNGLAEITFQAHPGFGVGDFKFTSRSVATINHFTLERAVNNSSSWTMLQSNIPANSTIAPDLQGRDGASNYFYRLTGYVTGGLSIVLPYNTVGLIHPYVLTVTGGTTTNNVYSGTVLSWSPPDVTNWPTDQP